MVGDKRQKGFVAVVLLIGLFIVLATVAAAYYLGKKAAPGPVEPPQTEVVKRQFMQSGPPGGSEFSPPGQ